MVKTHGQDTWSRYVVKTHGQEGDPLWHFPMIRVENILLFYEKTSFLALFLM